MPKATPIQTSFNGGIQSPLLRGHINAPRRDSSVADSNNLIPLKHGPVVRRGGTRHAGILREATTDAYLHRFEFSDTQSFILEFSEDAEYGSIFRVYKNNDIVFKSSNSRTITGITDVTDPVVTVSAILPPNSYRSGLSRIYISGLTQATELNDRWFKVKTKGSPFDNTSTFSIMNYDGTSIGGLSAAETSSTGTSKTATNQILPYCVGELFRADGSFIPKIVQSNDVIYITHPDYAPRVIVRVADDDWNISVLTLDNGPYMSNDTGINMISPYADEAPSSGYWAQGSASGLLGSASTSKFTMIPVNGDAIITAITNANPAVVTTLTDHGFNNGDVIEIAGLNDPTFSKFAKGGMTELNERTFTIGNVTATTFELNGIDSTNFSVYNYATGSGGVAYVRGKYFVNMDADVFVRTDAKYSQDINYITRGTNTLVDIRTLPDGTEIVDGEKIRIGGVSGLTLFNNDKFKVDNIAYKNRVITSISKANPASVVSTAHGLVTGSVVYIKSATGMTEVNNISHTITRVNDNEFTLDGVNSISYGSYTGSGIATTTQFNIVNACSSLPIDSSLEASDGTGGTVTRGETNRLMQIRFEDKKARTRWLWGRITKYVNARQIHWQVDEDAKHPPISWLRNDRGDFGNSKKFPTGPGGSDVGVYYDDSSWSAIDFNGIEGGDSWELGSYSDTTSYPSVVNIHQGRLVMGSASSNPRRLDMTETGGFNTTSASFKPYNEDGLVVDSNAISIDIGGGDGSTLQWAQSLGGALAVGSTSSEGMVEGGSAGSGSALTPGNAAYRTQSTSGNSSVQPVVIGRSLLHIQRTGRRLYELTYNIESDGYSALDLTELAEHLTRSGIIDFAWQQNPINTLWCVLANGQLIALTYEKNADVIGWHRHTIGGTDAKVKSVAVIPSTDLSRDELWMIVARTINGSEMRSVEYMSRWYEDDIDVRDCYHVDNGITYDASDVAVTGITNADPAVVTTGTHSLSTGDVVRFNTVLGMTQLNDVYFKVTVLSSTTFSIQYLDGLGVDSSSFEAFVSGNYQKAEHTFTGLSHLEGETVQILRDGQTHPDLIVCGSTIQLGSKTSKSITGATVATQIVITSVNHQLSNGDKVYMTDVLGMTELNNNCYLVANKSANTFELTDLNNTGINSSGFTAYTSGGLATVSDLNSYGATVHIGLANSWNMQTLKIEAGSADGTAQSKKKRIHKVFVRLMNTLGFKSGSDAANLDEEPFTYGTEVSSVPELYTGDIGITWNGGYDRDGQMYFKGEGPYPAQIQAIIPRVHTQDV